MIEASDLYLAFRRLRRRLTQLRRSITERPMVRAGGLIVLLSLLFSWFLFLIESQPPNNLEDPLKWPYRTYLGTLRQVGILLFSGFDAEAPQHTHGFLMAMLCLLMGIAFVALMTADLAAVLVTLAASSQGRRKVRISGHILICGWHDSIRVLVEQLTSRERDSRREIVVIDAATTRLPVSDPDVHFIQGDPTHEEALVRACTRRAHSVIVPCDSRLPEHLQDSAAALTVMAAKAVNKEMYTCAEVLRAESRRHLERLEIDEVVCLGELSQTLLAQASSSHGLSMLLEEILTFNRGNEVYRVPLPLELVGVTFCQLFRQLNNRRHAILLAVVRGESMLINPGGVFALEQDDALFVLAESRPERLEELMD